MPQSCTKWLFALVAGLSAGLGVASRALAVGEFQIHLNPGPNIQANPDALAAFERAAADWESRISSPIRINIDIDMQAVANTNVIGSTSLGPANPNLDYTTVRDLLAARSVRPGDGLLAYLPTTSQVTADVPIADGSSFDPTTMGITPANQKALGLLPNGPTNTSVDGIVTFNSNFSFDYDQSNGVDADKVDFQTAATHEIGHVLGFLSDTDDYDFLTGISDNATTLDLFRFNAASLPTTLSNFTTFPRELRPGQAASFWDLETASPMSTGAVHGDGRQASHWKDDFIFDPGTGTIFVGPLIGIMDPSLSDGTIESISPADMRVFELIGYDTVPEPAGLLLLGIIGLTLIRRTRRSSTSIARGDAV